MVLKALVFLGTCLIINSCCFSIKEEYLGNNLYLSEYDNKDRIIIYSEEECTGSGIEIVPMTVTEFAYNTKWIIAKSISYRSQTNAQFWIIKNDFSEIPDANKIKSNMIGPLDSIAFKANLKKENIDLELRVIE